VSILLIAADTEKSLGRASADLGARRCK